MCLSTVTFSSRPSGASLGSARQQAQQILKQIQAAESRVSYLGQKYDAAHLKLDAATYLITHTLQIVAAAQVRVSSDQMAVRNAAINYYVNAGALSQQNPIFSSNESDIGAAGIYTTLAEGNLTAKVAALRNSSLVLTQQRQILRHQQYLAAIAQKSAGDAWVKSETVLNRLHRIESSISGQISWYIHLSLIHI